MKTNSFVCTELTQAVKWQGLQVATKLPEGGEEGHSQASSI